MTDQGWMPPIPLCPWCGWYATIRTPDSCACPWCGATTNHHQWWRAGHHPRVARQFAYAL
jgi:hypothetical protein